MPSRSRLQSTPASVRRRSPRGVEVPAAQQQHASEQVHLVASPAASSSSSSQHVELAHPRAHHEGLAVPINGALHQLSDADFDQTVVVEGTGDILLPGTEARIVAPVFSVHPESLRLAAYLAFYGMIALAGLVTYMWVPDDLSVSPLVQYFGYNNVCVLFDYEPATTIVAMYYPCMEIPLLLYVVMNFLRSLDAYRNGHMGRRRFVAIAAMFPIEFMFVMWFRMIFVVKAFLNLRGHTLGFQGLMVALVLVAISNYLYHDAIGELAGTRKQSLAYLTALVAITLVKLVCVTAVINGTPVFDIHSVWGTRALQAIDQVWMLLASVAPAILAWKSRKSTPPLVLSYGTMPTAYGTVQQ